MKGVWHEHTHVSFRVFFRRARQPAEADAGHMESGALMGLSACVYPGGPHGPGGEPYPPTGQERCDATAALAVARGKRPTAAVQQRAQRAANAWTVRVLYKNQPVTREYQRGRLNLVVNEARRVIESAYCG